MDLTFVVLAAGKSTRFGRIKQLEPIGAKGETLAEYSLWDAAHIGFTKAVFVVPSALESLFWDRIGRKARRTIEFQCVAQPDEPMMRGTACALLSAERAVKTPFCVINADDHYGSRAIATVYRFLTATGKDRSADLGLVAYRLRNTLSATGAVTRGICEVSTDGFLKRIVDVSGIRAVPNAAYRSDTGQYFSGDELVSANIGGFVDSPFLRFRQMLVDSHRGISGSSPLEFGIPYALDRMITEDAAEVEVFPSGERCVGLTHPADRAIVRAHIRKLIEIDQYPRELWR
jgi:hypothetical protein